MPMLPSWRVKRDTWAIMDLDLCQTVRPRQTCQPKLDRLDPAIVGAFIVIPPQAYENWKSEEHDTHALLSGQT